ncbi:GntR family transcriptional regulator [Saccharopolyspora griseoalba]|uniref:GntR family transcriptional regulator n=1 Tax=Saccharopolyspora griseoalba TaxID=1431848 RepID=A0ABW2LT54_9PSEU
MTTAQQRRPQEPSWDPTTQISVDHNSPVPLYFQVASQIEEAIGSGALPVGARLDNEIDLASSLGLSRPTIRQAIGSLVDKGLVVRKRGAGTQVVFNHVKRSLELSSLYDDLSRIDQQPTTRVLVNELCQPGEEAAGALGISGQDEVLHLERVRYARGEPIARLRNYLPAGLIRPTDEQLAERGLYQLMRAAGVHLHAAQQTIGARVATEEEAELLDEPAGAALLTMQRTTHDHTGQVVEFGTHVYRASRYTFDLTLRGDT